jgi:hypothetical protein
VLRAHVKKRRSFTQNDLVSTKFTRAILGRLSQEMSRQCYSWLHQDNVTLFHEALEAADKGHRTLNGLRARLPKEERHERKRFSLKSAPSSKHAPMAASVHQAS